MFDRLKKALTREPVAPAGQPSLAAPGAFDDMLAWGLEWGLKEAQPKDSKIFAMTGYLVQKPWRLECGRSSRDYIRGDELRAKAEVNVDDNAAVLIMNRPLKEALEKSAYAMYTDTLQTTADPSLPEEMRWLAMYPEAEWPGRPRPFTDRYVALSDRLEHAVAWIDQELINLLIAWPKPSPDDQVPFILMLLRGKAYLRMQFNVGDVKTLEHATKILTKACSSAVAKLPGSI